MTPGMKLRSRILKSLLFARIPLLVLIHFVLFCGVYWLANLIRFDWRLPAEYVRDFWLGMATVVSIKLVTFYLLNHFHGWWRHVTFSDMVSLGRASVASSLLIVAIDHFLLVSQIPRTVIVIDWALTIVVLAILRSCWRLWDERVANYDAKQQCRRALLLGSDFESARMAHLINSQAQIEFKIVGLVAVGPTKRQRFGDIRVLGSLDEVSTLAAANQAEAVLVPSDKLSGPRLRDLLEASEEEGADFKVRVLPKLSHHFHGDHRIPIREVRIEDLLRREAVEVDQGSIGDLFDGKTVLVTGAGGSIGSELCRQLIRFNPQRLIILGRGENRIFHVERELRLLAPELTIIPIIASVTDQRRMEELFDTYRPHVVLHAAAHKHVPLSEANVGEAVLNNVGGVRVLADTAAAYDTGMFVQVSTDKTVNPTSVMGCTKQIADRYCLAMDSTSSTRFVVTRFGNVLGSEGSVVPLFKKQIQEGGPITITDPRMTRFFMTIPEATQLVLQSAAIGRGGNIYVLEMGEQVRIVDMAHDLIRFAGLERDSIDIVYTGVRPGEKLYEELFYSEQEVGETQHEKIMTVYHRPDGTGFREQVDALLEMAYDSSEKIRDKLAEMVPEYQAQLSQSAADAAPQDQIESQQPVETSAE